MPRSFSIVNLVATTSLGVSFSREEMERAAAVLSRIGEVTYNPRNFPGIIVRIKGGVTALLFSSGKIVVVGAKEPEQIVATVRRIVKAVSEVKAAPRSIRIMIQNVVGAGDLGYPINIEKLAYTMDGALYEPEQFPGMIWKLGIGKPVAIVFSTGKLVLVGAKSVEEAERFFEEIDEIIRRKLW